MMAERHVRAVQYYSQIAEDDVRHVMEIIALDIGRDDSPAHTSLRKIAQRMRRSVNKVRDLIDLAVASGELLRQRDGKFMVYSLNPDALPYGRTSKRENSGRHGQGMRPATTADLSKLEQKLMTQQEKLYQRLYHEIVSIVSRSVEGRDTEVIEKDLSNDDVAANKNIIAHFEQETALSADAATFADEWLPVIDDWRRAYGVEGAKARISRAVRFARGENERGKRYVITSPRSLVTIAANLPEGNGHGGTIRVGER